IEAEAYLPFVRNRPLPAPHRWRMTFAFAIVDREARGQLRKLPPVSARSVNPVLACVSLKTPSKKSDDWTDPLGSAVLIRTRPFVVSMTEPTGTTSPPTSGTKRLDPGACTRTVPLTTSTSADFPSTGCSAVGPIGVAQMALFVAKRPTAKPKRSG